MSYYKIVDCINCGSQTMVDLQCPGDTCLFCGESARGRPLVLSPVPVKAVQSQFDGYRQAVQDISGTKVEDKK